MTLMRVFLGFGAAMAVGIVLGTVFALNRTIEAVFGTWIMVALAIPGLVYVIISFMWFGLNEFSTIFSIALTAFPTITINIWEGVKNVDNKLTDMARVFNVSRLSRVWKVIIPQTTPYIMASSRFGLGLAWKVTVIVELLGRSSGVGYMLNYWFQMFNMRQVLAWTLFFSLVMIFIEVVVLKRLEEYLFSWRPDAKA